MVPAQTLFTRSTRTIFRRVRPNLSEYNTRSSMQAHPYQTLAEALKDPFGFLNSIDPIPVEAVEPTDVEELGTYGTCQVRFFVYAFAFRRSCYTPAPPPSGPLTSPNSFSSSRTDI